MNQDAIGLGRRLKHAWNAFRGKDQENIQRQDLGASYFTRPDRVRYHFGSERTILASIFTRIGMDAARVPIRHVRLDDYDRYIEDINSGLNYCLTIEANIDQSAKAFIQDYVMSMLDEGVAVGVPVDTTENLYEEGSFDIRTMRVGKVIEWMPQHVRVELYNDRNGRRELLILPKSRVAINENPLYNVMNEPISTLKRLIYKLNLMDAIDEKNSSSKLDLIIQMPFDLRTEMRRQEAEKRRQDIETQLTDNKYGIAYASSTEKITQLNRAVENKLMDEIEYLTSMLYSQLGMTKEVFEGSADPQVLRNYMSRTIEPIVSAISDEFNRKFLTKTARSQKQRVMYFPNFFELATPDAIINLGAQAVQSEIATKNEIRQLIGLKPAEDERADQLMNPNINPQDPSAMAKKPVDAMPGNGISEEENGYEIPENVPVSDLPISAIM